MKNKGIIIALIVLLIIIIIGLIGLLVFSINGGINFSKGFMNIEKRSDTIIFDKYYETVDINSLEIISDAGDVSFEKTSEENIRIQVYGKNSEDVKVNTLENKIKLECKSNKKSWFNFNFYKNDIVVYVPESYLGEIKVQNDYGNVEMGSFENTTIDVKSDCGNIEIEKAKNVTIKCDYGNVEIDTILNKCDIKSDCGNIEIEEAVLKENSIIKSDLGNVEIKKINDIHIDTEVDLGKTDIKQNNRASNVTLKIEADCGNITIGE